MIFQTDFTLFNSTLTVKSGVAMAKELGYTKAVLADTNLSGAVSFYKAAKEAGITPVIALVKEIEGVKYLLVSLNNKGFTELTTGESIGFTDSVFKSENITSIVMEVTNGTPKGAYASIELDGFTFVNIQIANSKNVKDFFTIASMKAVEAKSAYEKEIALGNVAITAMSTKEDLIADKVFREIFSKTVNDYQFGNPVPPTFKFTPEVGEDYGLENPTDETLFKFLTRRGLSERFPNGIPEGYSERLEFEMDVITKMAFPGYFLIVWDFIKFAVEHGIAVGPGRGSAAGSLVAYALRITNLDPMPYSLLFERFLNPDRVSLPDVDLDFCQERREEVINYVSEKYGKECVSQVITFGKLAAKAAIRDAARVIGAPLFLADKMAKMVSDKPGTTLKDSKSDFEEMIATDMLANRVWEKAVSMEGLKKNTGIHAAGLVISNDPIYTRAPLYDVNGTQAVGFEGSYLEDVNLVKYDFLGLKTLDVIDNSSKEIKRQFGKDVGIWTITFDDTNIYKYISAGHTVGMFQIEGAGMQDLAKRLQPKNFEEVTAMLALYRPGPMEAGMLDSFINRKHGREQVDYFFPEMEEALKPILEPTYGLIVYQEQVMQIVQAIAGFSLGEADLVRRAMGKKKLEEMVKISADFVARAVTKGYNEANSKKLFDLIEKFAGYGFNKSHSAAYAAVCYQTAWLKVYYPSVFMACLINSDIGNTDKLVPYVEECKRLGIEVSKPDVKDCSIWFTPVGISKITFGLKAVKGVGGGAEGLIETLKKCPKDIDLKSLFELTQRDIAKEIDTQEKMIVKYTKSLERLTVKKLDDEEKLANLRGLPSLTVRQESAVRRLIVSTNDFEAEIAGLESFIVQATNAKNQLIIENENSFERIDKRVLAALAEANAFSSFGVTSKSLLNNLDLILDPKKVSTIEFTSEEFTFSEKILMEEARVGFIMSDVFSAEDKALLLAKDIPFESSFGVLISKEDKKKKDGTGYLNVKFLKADGSSIEASDFNSVCAKFEIGDLCSLHLRLNGNYVNVSTCKKFNVKMLDNFDEVTPLTPSVTVMDTNPIIDSDKVEIKNSNGVVVAVFYK